MKSLTDILKETLALLGNSPADSLPPEHADFFDRFKGFCSSHLPAQGNGSTPPAADVNAVAAALGELAQFALTDAAKVRASLKDYVPATEVQAKIDAAVKDAIATAASASEVAVKNAREEGLNAGRAAVLAEIKVADDRRTALNALKLSAPIVTAQPADLLDPAKTSDDAFAATVNGLPGRVEQLKNLGLPEDHALMARVWAPESEFKNVCDTVAAVRPAASSRNSAARSEPMAGAPAAAPAAKVCF